MSSNIKITRICEFCQNEFIAKTTKTQYCSLKCGSRAYKARTRQSKIDQSNKQTEIVKNPILEAVRVKDFLSIKQAGLLFGISRSTIYRLVNRGQLDIGKFGKRTVIRRCDLDSFFAIPVENLLFKPNPQFPGFENCYTITEIQQKFKISSGALYFLIQRRGIVKYAIGKFTYVAKQDIDIIFNTTER
ncbi:helix-turn-helix domain-containing protein [Flavobacterium collinsii]|uniref:helix-turn-helix domain-containing protein n=1 Tax=Flavobacterium collinsii TaxID=1114861 RepID=UPI0037575A2C